MVINGGRYSKFQERLKKIVRNRVNFRKRRLNKEVDKDFNFSSEQKIYNLSLGRDNIHNNTNVKNIYVVRNKKEKSINVVKNNGVGIRLVGENNKVEKSNVNNSLKDKNENTFLNRKYVYVSNNKNDNKNSIDNLELFGLELINKIKNSFNDKLDKLDIMMSELYLLNDEQNNEVELKKIKDIKEQIEKLIKEINIIIEKYNLYNKNYYLDNVVGIDDKIIEDDIIHYRDLLDSKSMEKNFVKEYKLLDEFKMLYGKLIVIKHDTEVLMNSNEEKTRDFDIRDKKYKNIVDDVMKISDVQKECLNKMNIQNDYLKQLESKINIIDSHEYVTTRLKGLGELLGQGLKFIGLSLISPLAGIIPSIAINTLITKKLISDVYKNLHYEDIKHVYYSTIDYNRELSNKIVDISYTEDLIDDTLKDIKNLKETFLLQYDSNIPLYSDTLKKINDIENIIYRNQNKVNIIKKRLIMNKKVNEDKLVKVRKMNES